MLIFFLPDVTRYLSTKSASPRDASAEVKRELDERFVNKRIPSRAVSWRIVVMQFTGDERHHVTPRTGGL